MKQPGWVATRVEGASERLRTEPERCCWHVFISLGVLTWHFPKLSLLATCTFIHEFI